MQNVNEVGRWRSHEILTDLTVAAGEPVVRPDWLVESWQDPEAFWRRLKGGFDALYTIHGASALYNKYDFYHDITQRNRTNPHPALIWLDTRGVEQSISYSELTRLASIKAAKWVRGGVVSGQSLCLIRPVSLDLATDLLAAFKLGIVISILPVSGYRFMMSRIEALSPDHIATDTQTAKCLNEWSKVVLPSAAASCDVPSDHRNFHGYLSGDIVFRLFPTASSASPQPVAVNSDVAYLSAMRDGMIGLGLAPGKVVAAPGFSTLATQPALLLATLLCGATMALITPDEVNASVSALERVSVDVLGVTSHVRDLLIKKKGELNATVSSWFRNPVECMDFERWQSFAQDPAFVEAEVFNLRWDAALGGCILISPRRIGLPHTAVFAPPGSLWGLGEEGDADIFQAGELYLSPTGDDGVAAVATGLSVAMQGEAFVATGTRGLIRMGTCYPGDEILELLRERGSGAGLSFSLVSHPRVDLKAGEHIVLIVFTGARGGADFLQKVEAEIRKLLTREMGFEQMPDTVEVFSQFPRFIGGEEVDHNWCRGTYLSGGFARKSMGEIQHCITRLRSHFYSFSASGNHTTSTQ